MDSPKLEYLNYYAILGISNDASTIEIKRAYRDKLKKYHPDKIESNELNKETYRLVRQAGEILRREDKRKAYDHAIRQTKEYFTLKEKKEEYVNFIAAQKKEEFDEKNFIEFLNNTTEIPLEKSDFKRRMEDYDIQREAESIEITPDKMFDHYNSKEFGKYIRKKNNVQNDLIPCEQVTSSNDFSHENYASFDGTNENNNVGKSFAPFDGEYESNSNSESESESDDEFESDNKANENTKNDEDLNKKYDSLMQERISQNDLFSHMTEKDFKSCKYDKFGPSYGLGFMVGNDKYSDQTKINKLLEMNRIEKEAYLKLKE